MRSLIVFVALLALGPPDGLAAGRRDKVAIVDAHGKQVGTVVGARIADFTIALTVNGRHALLDVVLSDVLVYPGSGALLPFQGDTWVIFESQDCSGPGFLYQPPGRLFDQAAVAPPGITLYLPETEGAAPRPIRVGSFFVPLGICSTPDSLTLTDPPTLDLVPAVAIDLLTLFTPPFRLAFTE